ncbi:MAG: transporter substrate-binding domain-containing protein [Acetobacteraceae bacterium]|nr:transporter substrate-binding domain-containing protein [Acetobacteraceae bacterium]
MLGSTSRRSLATAAAILPAAGLFSRAFAQSGAESTFDRVQKSKVLRIAVLPGELPYFAKDLVAGTWSGACIDMAQNIAGVFDAKLAYVESTYGNSVLDLQSNKIDLAFALNPTPQRALSIGFTRPTIINPFGCIAKQGFDPKTWGDLDKPGVRVAFDIGSSHDTVAHRYLTKAALTGFKTRDDCVLALQSGRVDAVVMAATLGLAAVGKNPALGPYHLLKQPDVALPSSLGVQYEPDQRFRDVLNAWVDFNRGTGQIREWMLAGMEKLGVKRDELPPEMTF